MLKGIKVSRRAALKSLLVVSAGVAAVLLGGSELLALSQAKNFTPTKSGTRSSSSYGSKEVTGLSASSSAIQTAIPGCNNIKAAYFGMSVQMTGVKEEYFVLHNPVYLQDLLSKIEQEHEAFATMLPTMQIVVNGEPTQDNPQLADHAEVDFIPVYAGG